VAKDFKNLLLNMRTLTRRLARSCVHVFKREKNKTDLTAKQVYSVAKKTKLPNTQQLIKLPSLLSRREKIIAHISIIACVISFFVAAGCFYFSHLENVPASGGEYTEGLVGEPQFINPILSQGSTIDTDLTRLVFRGLFKFDPVEGLVPDIATSYEVDEEETTYTMHLRDDVLWHDGEKLSAYDVAFTFQAISDPEYKSPLAVSFKGVNVEVVDDLTVVFKLSEPFSPFIASLTVGILPAHIWESVTPKRALLTSFNLQPIGNGPYKFEKFNKDQNGIILSYTMKCNKNFYENEPLIDTLTFKFYNDTKAASDALFNRNVEGLALVSEDSALDLEKSRFAQVLRPSLPQQTVVIFNQTRQATLKDANLRNALNAAIDREEIINDIFGGNATPLSGPLLNGIIEELPEPQIRDIAKAEELMDKTDWKRDPITHLRQKKNSESDEMEILSLTITTADSENMLAVAEKLKSFWSPLGINVSIASVPQNVFYNDVIKQKTYDVLLTGLLFGAYFDPFPFWHSSQNNEQGVNMAQYSNRKVDSALEEIRTSTDVEKRATAYKNFQTMILEDTPALFLVQPRYSYVTASKINGINLRFVVTPSDRFGRIEEWHIKTKKAFRLTK
jgi:peptide/nickel transport system substrate-binding protein